MQRLDRENRAGDGEVLLAGDQASSAEVCAGADAFEDGRQSDEARNVSGREGVSASLHRSGASGLDGRREGLNVHLLVVSDVAEVVVVVGGVTGGLEVRQAVVLEGLLVEDILQMLQSQRELEDGNVDVCLTLLERLAGWCSDCKASQCGGRKEFEGNHVYGLRIAGIGIVWRQRTMWMREKKVSVLAEGRTASTYSRRLRICRYDAVYVVRSVLKRIELA